jgi:hypothetical protein
MPHPGQFTGKKIKVYTLAAAIGIPPVAEETNIHGELCSHLLFFWIFFHLVEKKKIFFQKRNKDPMPRQEGIRLAKKGSFSSTVNAGFCRFQLGYLSLPASL